MTDEAVYPSLAGRTVLVTGGASGIGASIVEHFCRQGAQVSFFDIKADSAAALIEAVKLAGLPAPRFVPCDLRDVAGLQAAVASVEAADGPVAALVNNAASDDRHRIEDVSAAYWDERIATNLRHQFFAAQAVIPGMKRLGGGSIINFGSMTWHASEGGYPVYATCKAAVEGLTRSLARDLGPLRIRANTLIPGWVMTDRQMALWLDAEGEAEIQRRQCLKDKVRPADIARMVLFLAADDSRMCTAQNFIVDAGWI
ncbi:MAG: SDR family oxidoreductase [Geminicoccaceae bacterium]